MSDCPYDIKLQDLFDGVLSPDREAETAAHLRDCAACAAAWDDMLALSAAAADLPAGLSPDRDLWPGIEARLDAAADADAVDVIVRPRSADNHRWLAAAAVAAFVLLAGLQLRDGGGDDPYDALARSYSIVRDDCRAGLRDGDSELPAETRTAVDDGLDLIDQAIRETQNALDKVSAAPAQASRLVAGYQKKIDLLEKLARLASK